jgi:hypothetical protein
VILVLAMRVAQLRWVACSDRYVEDFLWYC